MSTGNFYNKNASCIYAIIPEEGGDDELFWEDAMDNVRWHIKEMFKRDKHVDVRDEDQLVNSSLRSYPERIIASIQRSKYYEYGEVAIIIDVIMRSGYYEGANLDYNISYIILDYEADSTDKVGDCVENRLLWPEGKVDGKLAERYVKWIENWLDKTESALVDKMEKALEKASTQKLYVKARFSNGETIYAVCGA